MTKALNNYKSSMGVPDEGAGLMSSGIKRPSPMRIAPTGRGPTCQDP